MSDDKQKKREFQVLTRKDYDFYECSSAFQKSVRRGQEQDAIFFGTELAGSGYCGYLWKRMLIIVSEDIGLAEDNACVQLQALYQNWLVISAKSIEEGMIPTIHAIMLLSRAKKNRAVDDAKIFALKSGFSRPIPDYALDVHTRKGKSMGRDHKFFIEVGSKVENYQEVKDTEIYANAAKKYFTDYAEGKAPITGYDEKNIFYPNLKAMQADKVKRSQKVMDL